MPRPRKIRPADIKKAVDGLVREYENEGVLPTDFRLTERLGVTVEELDGYYREGAEPGSDEYSQQMKRLIQFRRQICVEALAQGKQATGWIFLSKQPRWGGMRDMQKSDAAGRAPVEILLCGADGKPLKLEP